ncbi:MAG TPA: hypothetical protein VMJ65_21625 [Solirubrobacteraceae bacterium]|nr:hypothetical protein [Solirubrobacteraceae bacterium]
MSANFLSSNHWVHFTDSEQRQVYVLSGTVILDPPLVGPQDGSRWQRGTTDFDITLPDLPEGQGLVIEQWAPTVVLGSIQNDGVAENAGWAVDDFNLEVSGEASTVVTPTFNYAVGDTDGYMMRVAYSVTVVGYYAPLPIIE